LEVNLIYIDKFHFEYKNVFHKAQNFFSKLLFNINLKKRSITKNISSYKQQDTVLIIRPDLLDDYVLSFIKGKTNKFIAFYFDSAQRLTRKRDIIHFFDKIYSFDKTDVQKYGFDFITNYIFEESPLRNEHEYLFFNISGNDDSYRFGQLENLASYLKNRNWSFNFISVDTKNKTQNSDLITVINDIIYVDKVSELIKQSKILVEFQRKDQIGLSFRIFEALGHHKKLITTNKDVVNYDFYNPENILVVDPDNLHIPEDFVNSPYVEIDDAILAPYQLENWVKRVFDL
jgi:hypothetical protein